MIENTVLCCIMTLVHVMSVFCGNIAVLLTRQHYLSSLLNHMAFRMDQQRDVFIPKIHSFATY